MRKWLIVSIGMFVVTVGAVSLYGTEPEAAAGTEVVTTVAEVPVVTDSVVHPSYPSVDYASEVLKTYARLKTDEEWAAVRYVVAITPPPKQLVITGTKPAPPKPPAVKPAPQVQQGGSAPNGFLACVKQRESGGNYGISNYGGSGAGGAYQLMPETARNTANHAGRPDLAGRPVTSWSPADQDAMAAHLYQWQGAAPWAGPGC